MTDIRKLNTIAEIELYVERSYYLVGNPARGTRPEERTGRLPLAVAEPGPLIERAVEIAGPEGLTLQQVRAIFGRLGKERYERGLRMARASGSVTERREPRPNRGGRLQSQVVLRWADGMTDGMISVTP